MNHFTAVTSEKIVSLISDASFQVVYVAPAMDIQIAQAIAAFVKRTSRNRVMVTLDCSPDVYREGYGEIAALEILDECHVQVKDVRGLRMGLFIADGQGWIYAPISKEQGSVNEKKNAVTGSIEHPLFQEYVHALSGAQLDLFNVSEEELSGPAVRKGIVSRSNTLDDTKINKLKEELMRQPAPDFSLQKKLSQYRSLIQFVEITFTGGRLEKTTIKIPSHLLNIAKEKGFEEKVKASYQLFDKSFSVHTKPMAEKVERLRGKYTHTIPKYGNVILMREKERFLQEFGHIKEEIEVYTVHLQKEVAKQIENTKRELINNFTPILMMNPPGELLNNAAAPLEEEAVRGYIDLLLSDEIPHAEEVLKRIELHSTFKDITEETLKDEQFYRQLEKAFKGQNVLWPHQQLHQEEMSFM